MANDVLSRGKASSPRCTDGHCEIDIRWWQRANLLNPGMMFSCEWSQNRIAVAGLRVAIEENRVLMNYHNISGLMRLRSERRAIDLAWTSCHFGGSRAWFRCPEVTCGRLAAILYAERNFVCRRCARLVYQSQREGLLGRAISRIEKIRHRLGWSEDWLDPAYKKPKGMHWETFDALLEEHDGHFETALANLFGTQNEVADSVESTEIP